MTNRTAAVFLVMAAALVLVMVGQDWVGLPMVLAQS